MEIKELTIKNYEELLSLWESINGTGLNRDSDTKERVWIYLQRNPGLSFAALEKGKVIGAVLCGHDGRRGYMHHLAIVDAHRNKGIGKALVEKVTSKLRMLGIRKCNTFVFSDNVRSQEFWKNNGWVERTDLKVFSKSIAP